jgi:hypothetical protein
VVRVERPKGDRVRAASRALCVTVVAAAACGRLGAGDYRPPPIATVRGTLTLPGATATAPDARVHVLVVWQPAGWTPDPADVPWQSNPMTSGATPACRGLAPTCDGAGADACSVRYGLAEEVATLPFQVGPLEFEAPIYALPPPEARLDLTSRGGAGTLAFGYLLFAAAPPDQVQGAPVLASSAFNGPPSSVSTAYRSSAYLAFLDGEAGPVPCAPGCDPGVLARLRPGLGLVLKLEEEVAGRRRPVTLAVAPVDTRLDLTGEASGAGGAYCDVVHVSQQPVSDAPATGWTRCTTSPELTACDAAPPSGPGCYRDLLRLEAPAACVQASPACGHLPAASPLGTAAGFLRLPSGAVLGAPAGARAWFLDVAGEAWRPTGALTFPRTREAALVLLASGELLVTGGSDDPAFSAAERDAASRSAELLDPATGRWCRTGSMRRPRSGHASVELSPGRILAIGGRSEASPGGSWDAELFDASERTWSDVDLGAGGPPLLHPVALALGGDGTALVLDAEGGTAAFLCLATGCRPTAPMGSPHPGGTFTRLPSGKVIALGGRSGDRTVAELFDPAAESWTPAGPMPTGRADHAAALLPDGTVLVAGGTSLVGGLETALASADRYLPGADRWVTGGELASTRSAFTLVPEPGGTALAVGGHDATGGPLPAERLCPPPPARHGSAADGRAGP